MLGDWGPGRHSGQSRSFSTAVIQLWKVTRALRETQGSTPGQEGSGVSAVGTPEPEQLR